MMTSRILSISLLEQVLLPRITVAYLSLDYSNAESWLGSFYTIAICCLDDDLELHQLLDLDAEGIDDPGSHIENVLAE